MRRTVTWGRLYDERQGGLARGSPLSPLLGALYLSALDEAVERLGLFYVRFMDEVLVRSPTRWKLKAAVRVVNQVLNPLELKKTPDKTFIGRVEEGFNFLGSHFDNVRLSVARQVVATALRALGRSDRSLH